MAFALGMVAGAILSFIIWVAYFGPKHWDWYQQNKAQAATIVQLAQERDHYKAITKPTEWGPVDQHEARIQPKAPPYQGVTLEPGQSIDFVFDDIRDGGE